MGFFLLTTLATTLLCITQLIYTRYFNGLASIPGPFTASCTNLWKLIAVYRGMAQRNIEVHKKYGPVVRIGPKHVSFSSTEALQTIHASRSSVDFPKSDFYAPTSPPHDGGPLLHLISIQDVNYHTAIKRSIASIYSKNAVLALEGKIETCVKLFNDQVYTAINDGPAEMDMSLWLHLYAFDCLGEINVSKTFGLLKSGSDPRGMVAKSDRLLYMIGLCAQAPLLQVIQDFVKANWSTKKNNPLVTYTLAEVKDRMANPKDGSDMLDKFLKLHEAQPDKLSIREIAGSLYINLMAGHDALAITLRSIFYYLCRDPHITAKLRAEIGEADAKYPIPSTIPYSEITNFTYLDAIIHESLRIHPNIGVIQERVVPSQGATISGYFIPGGTIVGVNAWVMQNNTSIFGEDIKTFKPSRWIDCSPEKLAEMKKNLFAFGAGPRGCIGRNLAMMQMGKLIVEFYRRFDAKLAYPEKEWSISGGWMTNQTEMNMIITPLKSG